MFMPSVVAVPCPGAPTDVTVSGSPSASVGAYVPPTIRWVAATPLKAPIVMLLARGTLLEPTTTEKLSNRTVRGVQWSSPNKFMDTLISAFRADVLLGTIVTEKCRQ